MTNIPPNDGTPPPRVARVDALVDENGSRINVPNDSGLKVAGEHDATVGATGPTNWWLYGVIGLAIVIAIVLFMQMFSGAPGTDVQPGTPTSEPVVETPADAAVEPAVEAPAAEPAVEEPADAAVDEPVEAAPAATPATDAPATEAPATEPAAQ